MSKSNLEPVPQHRGDLIEESNLRLIIKAGLWRLYVVVRVILKRILWKLMGISSKIPVASFLGQTPIYVIDVGAAGGFHHRWEDLGQNLRVFLFEPEPEAFHKLVEAYRSDNRVRVFDCALSEDGRELPLHVTRWPRASSVFPPLPQYVEASHIRDHYSVVEVLTLLSKRLVDVYAEKDLDFIKIDVEGYELPILKGAGHFLDQCIGLELEIYFQQVRIGQPLFADVDCYCRDKGFTFMDFQSVGEVYNYSHFLLPSSRLESKGFASAGDAIYFRWPRCVIKLVEDGKWNCQKIYKAVALYLAYKQHEFAYVLLKLAEEKHLIQPSDPSFCAAMKVIEDCSGYNKSFLYHKIRKL